MILIVLADDGQQFQVHETDDGGTLRDVTEAFRLTHAILETEDGAFAGFHVGTLVEANPASLDEPMRLDEPAPLEAPHQ